MLDFSAVERLLTRSPRSLPARLIIPAQAFLNSKGDARLASFHGSGWAPPMTTIEDTLGIDEIRRAAALRDAGVTECQAAGLVIAHRENARFITRKCEVLVACAASLLGAERIHDERDLWKLIATQ